MLLLIPPRRRTGFAAEDAGADRLRRLLVRGLATLTTVLITAWFCTLGWLPSILALVTAKHVLVAILLMDLGVDESQHR